MFEHNKRNTVEEQPRHETVAHVRQALPDLAYETFGSHIAVAWLMQHPGDCQLGKSDHQRHGKCQSQVDQAQDATGDGSTGTDQITQR